MAKQGGTIFIEGTLDDLTFYKMYGVYYVRKKSSLTRKKVLKSPRFALTRMHSNQLAEASRIASIIYRQFPKEEKRIQLFRSIVGKAKVMLAEGKEKEVVLESLCFEYRTRNKEQMKVKGERERFEKLEKSECLLVNEMGRLIGDFYRASCILNHNLRFDSMIIDINCLVECFAFLAMLEMTKGSLCVADPSLLSG